MEFPDLNITDFDNKTESIIEKPKKEDFDNIAKLVEGWKIETSMSMEGSELRPAYSRVEYKSKYGLMVIEYKDIPHEKLIDTKKAELIVIKQFSYHPISYTVH